MKLGYKLARVATVCVCVCMSNKDGDIKLSVTYLYFKLHNIYFTPTSTHVA